MPENIVNQALSFRDNPRHYPRKVFIKVFNFFHRPVRKKPIPDTIQSVLILSQEKLGDAVLLMPLLKGLAQQFPGIKIDILCTRHNEDLFKSVPSVGDTFNIRQNHELKRALQRKYDIFYSPKDHPSITASRLARKVLAKITVCLSHDRHNKHFNFALQNYPDAPIIEKNAELIKQYGVLFPIENYFPIPKNTKTITQQNTLSINVSSGSSYRIWPQDHWIELLKLIHQKFKVNRINLFAMEPERSIGETLKQQFPAFVNFPLKTKNLIEAAKLLMESRFLLSPDTALVHTAAACGIPIVGLYSGDMRNVKRYAPYNIESEIVQSVSHTLSDISPDEVFQAVLRLDNKISDKS